MCGLLVAAMVWLTAPEFLGLTSNDQNATQTANGGKGNDELSGPVSYAAAARRAKPSVVNIYTSKTVSVSTNPLLNDPFFRRLFNNQDLPESLMQEQRSLGTGVVVSSDGYILTNEHVTRDADVILVLTADGRQAQAEVIGIDAETDLAVLKVALNGLTPISVGDAATAQVGDVVLAIGNPQNLGQTVTQGILSATGRNLTDMGQHVNVNFLQTDAAINAGNSGGPLVDAYGNMIGINSRTVQNDSSFGLSFAIPADIALKVFRDIVEHGKVIRGWLGINAQARQFSEESSQSLGLTQGLLVTEVAFNGPAAKAGLQPGDVIIRINGDGIVDGRRVPVLIADTPIGNSLSFEILRGSQTLNINAIIGLQPEQPSL